MKENQEKPSPEAKALSLFLMAFKTQKTIYKEQSKRINRLWGMVQSGEMEHSEYLEKVKSMLTLNGGYSQVIEKTVRHYLETTGSWNPKGNDQYVQDAKKIADRISKK